MSTSRSQRAEARMVWLLRYMTTPAFCRTGCGFVVAWDEKLVDDFVKAFPEAEKTLRVYLVGSNSSPMLNRAAKRAEQCGYLTPGRIGNECARELNQRTWCRTWRITDAGREFLKTLDKTHEP